MHGNVFLKRYKDNEETYDHRYNTYLEETQNVVDYYRNNGELKVFKSPGEGNYIVRLMNVSLSPQDNLGRMLHTF